MHPRLAEEWDDIVSVYPDVRHHASPERIELTLDLDLSLYSRATTPTAVLVPAGYRTTGPDGFLVPVGLRFATGGDLPAADASGSGMPGWLLVSFHCIDGNGSSTWRPTADPTHGDNFVGYLASIESFLARSCS